MLSANSLLFDCQSKLKVADLNVYHVLANTQNVSVWAAIAARSLLENTEDFLTIKNCSFFSSNFKFKKSFMSLLKNREAT